MNTLKPLLIGAIIAVSVFACKKELLDINFAFPETPIVLVSDATITDTIVEITHTKVINIDSLAKSKNTSASKLKSIKPTKFKFELLPTSSETNFNNFKSGTVSISETGLAKTLVGTFSTANINPGATSFEMLATGIDVLPYIKSGNFTVTCKIISKGAETKPFSMKITMVADGVANPTN